MHQRRMRIELVLDLRRPQARYTALRPAVIDRSEPPRGGEVRPGGQFADHLDGQRLG